jgi:hypothetical protein
LLPGFPAITGPASPGGSSPGEFPSVSPDASLEQPNASNEPNTNAFGIVMPDLMIIPSPASSPSHA